MWVWGAHVLKNTVINILCFTRVATCQPSDDYNRVILKLDEGHSRDSNHDEEEEEDESSDEEDDGPTKYINASHINVRLLFFLLIFYTSSVFLNNFFSCIKLAQTS